MYGFDQMFKQSGIQYYLFEGLLLLLGAFFYTVGHYFSSKNIMKERLLTKNIRCGYPNA